MQIRLISSYQGCSRNANANYPREYVRHSVIASLGVECPPKKPVATKTTTGQTGQMIDNAGKRGREIESGERRALIR